MVTTVHACKDLYQTEEAEQGKIPNVKFEEKKSTRTQNGTKRCVQGDRQIKKWNKGSGNLRVRSNPAKFPNCNKELRKSLEPGTVVHAFNPGTGKVEAVRS